MSEIKYHLAQLNITRMRAPLHDPIMKEFNDFLDPVNKLAEESPGFVWRYTEKQGEVLAVFEDAMIVANMSVWVDYPSLKAYTYDTVHNYFLKSRKKWFEKMDSHQVVLWWVETDHTPSLSEAKERLDQLNQQGASPSAFGLREMYHADGSPLH
ncbi:MAG: DUF3291 domain-containing protein [Reichenbachiella sp.]|uniref:DUF3291 domain-containing protein n=1 Tax=Reichenbachiella sp. TaxID=2184521 RepID=UPI0029660812|nr:DUF3291 domain-containing protein [Reichenbachiella sp.]MDW3212239.1 DUF3291 domain-containing protein [Reichenbachiella sp.]